MVFASQYMILRSHIFKICITKTNVTCSVQYHLFQWCMMKKSLVFNDIFFTINVEPILAKLSLWNINVF